MKKGLLFFIGITLLFIFGAPYVSNRAFGYGYGYDGYGYSCGGEYGYKNECNKKSVNYKRYKNYSEKIRGAKTIYKRNFFKVKYFRSSHDPAINSQYWAMKNVYDAHKFDSNETFAKLDEQSKEMFKAYKKYRIYWQYRKYKSAVFD